MALKDHVSDSEASEASLIWISDGEDNSRELPPESPALSHRFRAPSEPTQEPLQQDENENENEGKKAKFRFTLPAPSRPWEYMRFPPSTTVENILAEIKKPTGETWYRIEYDDGLEEDVSI
jgi:chromodomain-helicase-DNA-binding protein 4